MNIRCFPRTKSAQDIDRMLPDLTDGTFTVVAAEIFDHPESGYSATLGIIIGPWVVGPEDEVHQFCAVNGWEDYEVQYIAP